MVALSLTAMMGFAGLAVDVGLWYNDKRVAHGAADSAAYTAAWTYSDDGKTASAVTYAKAAAIAVAGTYGYVNGSNGVTVTVNNPPASGSHTSNSGAFEVIITRNEPLFFAVRYLSALSVSSRSVALITTTGGGGNGAGCMLQGSSSGSTNMSNGITVTANGCGFYGNGSSSSALSVTGGAKFTVSSLTLVGGINTNNGGVISDSGAKVTGASTTVDPYASETAAVTATAESQTCPQPGNLPKTTYSSGGSTYNISPGVYCGGLSISNGVTVNMAPGIYYVVGGQFSLQGGTTTNATGGVTIVLTGSGSNYATANIANGVNLNLTSPSSGPTAGIAILGDTNAPLSNTSTIAGGANMLISGAMDLWSQSVNFSNGSTNGSACTQLIAGSITFTGGVVFTNCAGADGTLSIGSTPTVTSNTIVE